MLRLALIVLFTADIADTSSLAYNLDLSMYISLTGIGNSKKLSKDIPVYLSMLES